MTALAARPTTDRAILAAVLALSAVGVVAVYSAVSFFADVRGSSEGTFLLRHAVRVGLGLAAMAAFSFVDYRRHLARVSRPLLIVSLALLASVQVAGLVVHGAQRWLSVGGLTFQPSELAAVALLLHVAVLLARKQGYIGDWQRGFAPLLVWIVPTVALVGIDNLSTAAVLSLTVGAMLFVGRARPKHLAAVGAAGALIAVLFLLTSPHRAARVEAYLGVKLFPGTEAAAVFDAQDEGYQADQAAIAIALGGLTGVGPGKSIQRDFLPAAYNDFIFAIVAEEYGLVGALALLAVFVFIVLRGFLRVAKRAADPLGLFLAVGITTLLALGGFVNAGVAVGVLPVTGLPMPFVSYGGTAILFTGAMVGVLLNISRQTRDA